MRRIDLAARAKLIILPTASEHAKHVAEHPKSSPVRRDGTIGEAVRHVMEELPTEERHRAVIQTATRLMFFSEIEAIFETVVLRAAAA